VRVFDVLVRDGGQSLLARADFVHTALLVKTFDSTLDISPRELLNDRFQLRITLSHDLVEMSRVDSGFLKLVIRPTGVDGFMLADVADEQHAILRAEALQKCVHLLRARQARFVKGEQAFLIRRRCFFLLSARQMPLQRARINTGLGQLMGRA